MNLLWRRLFQAQQPLYEIRVRRGDDAFLGHVAFAFLGLFGKNVPFEGLLVGDLTGAGYFEPFLGTGIRFNLGHCECFFRNSPAGGSLR